MAPPARVAITYVRDRNAPLLSLVLATDLCVLCAITPSLAYAYDGQLQEYDDVPNIAARAARVVDVSSDLVVSADAVGVDQISDVPDYTNAGPRALTSTPGASFSYDDDGRQVSRTPPWPGPIGGQSSSVLRPPV